LAPQVGLHGLLAYGVKLWELPYICVYCQGHHCYSDISHHLDMWQINDIIKWPRDSSVHACCQGHHCHSDIIR